VAIGKDSDLFKGVAGKNRARRGKIFARHREIAPSFKNVDGDPGNFGGKGAFIRKKRERQDGIGGDRQREEEERLDLSQNPPNPPTKPQKILPTEVRGEKGGGRSLSQKREKKIEPTNPSTSEKKETENRPWRSPPKEASFSTRIRGRINRPQKSTSC